MKQNWKSWLPLGGMLFALYLAIHYWTPFCRLAGLGLQAAAPLLLGAVMAYASCLCWRAGCCPGAAACPAR